MISNLERFRKEIQDLSDEGIWLSIGLKNEMGITISQKELVNLSDEMVEKVRKASFRNKYQRWYNASLAAIRQLLPDRVEDFVSCYHSNSRKKIDLSTYGIEDYLFGLTLTSFSKESNYGFIRQKFEMQHEIVRSLKARLDSSLFEMRQLVEADLYDSEVEAAAMLAKKGFLRGAGAICGVVLERHLKSVAMSHGLKITKKTPTINDLNELLKKNDVIDVAQWRNLQYLGDLRNLCDHDKPSEPTADNLDDLVNGVKKALKTIY